MKELDKTYSFAEIAEQLGISEAEIVEIAYREGLIDENGTPTPKAISEGLLTIDIKKLIN